MLHRIFFAIVVILLTGTLSLANEGHALKVVMPDGEEQSLFLDQLDAMEQVEFSTTTIWTDDEVHFSGVAITHLLKVLGADGATLRMSALNDYSVEMPVADLEDDVPIIATRMQGQTMSVRDKGPYWVMFPFDRDPEYRTEANYARSVWQLQMLTLLD